MDAVTVYIYDITAYTAPVTAHIEAAAAHTAPDTIKHHFEPTASGHE